MARKPAASQRARRLSDLIQRELSMLFFRAFSGTREPGPTITAVEVTNDLSFATVWVTQLNGDGQAIENHLNTTVAQWRKALAPALASLHKMPKLRFKYDNSLEHSLHMHHLIAHAIAQSSLTSETPAQNSDTPSPVQEDEQ